MVLENIPNFNTISQIGQIWPQVKGHQKATFSTSEKSFNGLSKYELSRFLKIKWKKKFDLHILKMGLSEFFSKIFMFIV